MMKNIFLLILFSFLIISCVQNQRTFYDYDVEERIAELGIELKEPTPPTANFALHIRSGNLVFLSGHAPVRPEGGLVIGKLGKGELTLEEGQAAARLAGISLLNTLKSAVGDLNKVKRIVKVTGMINADPSFTQHSQVVNGFSDLMVEIFGERGQHARVSVGMGSLPGNIAIEIDLVAEVAD